MIFVAEFITYMYMYVGFIDMLVVLVHRTLVGIGGFIAKPRQIRGPPKLVVHGPHTADGQPPVLLTSEGTSGTPAGEADISSAQDPNDAAAAKKTKRKQRKKGVIEDTYPVYLQVWKQNLR